MKTIAIAMAAVTLAPFSAAPSELPDITPSDVTRLPEVTVTSARLQAPDTANSDTASRLSHEPGTSVAAAGGVSGLPVLHGLADDRIKIRIDGAELTSACGNHMNPPLSYINPAQLSSARVIAGITPVSIGGDSIAGTIEVASPQPAFASDRGTLLSGRFAIAGRSIDNGVTTSAQAGVASDRLSISYSGAMVEADSYEDGRGNKVADTLYKSVNQSLTLGARGEGNRWALKLGRQDIPYQGFPNQAMDMVKNRGLSANLGYGGDFSWGTLDGRLYWQDTRHKMGFFTPEKPGTMPMDMHGRDIGYTLKATLPDGTGGSLRFGNEFHRFALDDWWPPVAGSMTMSPDTYMSINDGRRERFALFAEWERKLDAQWTALLGVRGESVKTDAGNVQGYGCGMMCAADTAAAVAFNARDRAKRDNNLDATLLFTYEPAPTSSYEFGLARKTRSPNLYERYTWGRGEMAMAMIGWFGDGNGYVGDIDLKPEVAHTLSAAAEWHDAARSAWMVKLVPFYTHVRDYIDVDDLGAGMMVPRLLQFANHDAHLYGVNVSWLAPVWDSRSYGTATLNGKLDWTRGRRNDGGDLYRIMPPNLMLSLEQSLNAWTNSAELQLVGRKSSVDARRLEDVTGGYALVNLSTRLRLRNGVTLQAGVRNLFDRFYTLPLGGRNLAAMPSTVLYAQGRSLDIGIAFEL